MSADILTVVTSLGGVLLGGSLSFMVQRFTQQSADRVDRRRLAAVWAEARRAERLALFDRLLAATQDAERVAIDRYERQFDGHDWDERASRCMDRVWNEQKAVDIACSKVMREPTMQYADALNSVVWHGPTEGHVWEHLHPTRGAFIAAAKLELEALEYSADQRL